MGQGLVSKELIRHIKERTDITEVVAGYVGLTRTGQNMKGLCPFHAEKTPSFTVSPSRQVFHCFGCGVGGDVFAFVMKRENLGFGDALRELGRRAGVAVSETAGGPTTQEEGAKERILKINESAAAWFRHNLLEPQGGQEARAYLATRGVAAETSEAFALGLSSSSWDGLIRALSKEGVAPGELASAGLAVAKEQGPSDRKDGGYYDRFRGRVMFPIYDLRRRLIGFGGRLLGDGVPKYLNTPDTVVFKKGRALYGLERAREAAGRTNSLVVVEGYFDAIALSQAGIRHVVATLGTALTPEHVRVLGRFARRVVLLFDPDPAGVRAAVRTLDLFRDSGIGVRVVSLPDGDDPDTFVRRQGAEAFLELEARSPSLVEFAVEQSLRGAASGAFEERVRSVDDILRVLQKTDNRIEKEECLRIVAERLGISQKVLVERYPELLPKEERIAGRPAQAGATMAPRPKGNPEERELVRLLLQGCLSPDQVRTLASEAFSVPACRRIVDSALRHRDEDGNVLLHEVLEEMVGDPECGPIATELSLSEGHYDDLHEYIRGCLERLERKRREQCLSELITKLRAAERDGRLEDVERLNVQVNALRAEKAVGAPRPG